MTDQDGWIAQPSYVILPLGEIEVVHKVAIVLEVN